MKKKRNFVLKSKYLLAVLTVFCLGMIFLTFATDMSTGPLKTVTGFVIMPIQKGINQVGGWLSSNQNYFKRQEDLVSTNKELEDKVAQLTDENSKLISEKSELENLRQLYQLDQDYIQLGEKVAAKVISKDPGNWFENIVIDRGSNSGITKDMAVISGTGLVGIVTEVGPDWSTVRTIIDDMSNVKSSAEPSQAQCMISGDLKLRDDGKLKLFDLNDSEGEVTIGSKIVTSNISTKYLDGIQIGTIDSLTLDSNNTTKSGTVIPAVDFKHLNNVLVIKKVKDIGGNE